MSSDLSILNMAGAMARHAAFRHRTIAENLSNSETPGYKAMDVKPFDAALFERAGATPAETESVALRQMMRAHEIENAPTSPNGNSVAVDDQMARAVDAQAQHNAALSIYRKSLELLRLSFASQR